MERKSRTPKVVPGRKPVVITRTEIERPNRVTVEISEEVRAFDALQQRVDVNSGRIQQLFSQKKGPRMQIALDYDDTWTKDPEGWEAAIRVLKESGHVIYGVTMRYPEEAIGMNKRYAAVCDKIFFTGRKAKWYFMQEKRIKIDVWIDDSPHWIMRDSLQ